MDKVELRHYLFAAYASRHGYALVYKRLFMPEAWFTETSAARRTTCEVPEDVGFQTKPQFAVAMWWELREEANETGGGRPGTRAQRGRDVGQEPARWLLV